MNSAIFLDFKFLLTLYARIPRKVLNRILLMNYGIKRYFPFINIY